MRIVLSSITREEHRPPPKLLASPSKGSKWITLIRMAMEVWRNSAHRERSQMAGWKSLPMAFAFRLQRTKPCSTTRRAPRKCLTRAQAKIIKPTMPSTSVSSWIVQLQLESPCLMVTRPNANQSRYRRIDPPWCTWVANRQEPVWRHKRQGRSGKGKHLRAPSGRACCSGICSKRMAARPRRHQRRGARLLAPTAKATPPNRALTAVRSSLSLRHV